MSKDRRDDLYRLATLLAEIDRVLHPLDRSGLGLARVQPSIPPPLPPTGAAGGAPGGGRPTAGQAGPVRGSASGSTWQRPDSSHEGRHQASGAADRHRSADRPWVEPPPAGDRADSTSASDAVFRRPATVGREPHASASGPPGETQDGPPAEIGERRNQPGTRRPKGKAAAQEGTPTPAEPHPAPPYRPGRQSERKAVDAPLSREDAPGDPPGGTRVAAPQGDVGRTGSGTPSALDPRSIPTSGETGWRSDRVVVPPATDRARTRVRTGTSTAPSSGLDGAERPHRAHIAPDGGSPEGPQQLEPSPHKAVASPDRNRDEPAIQPAIRVPPPDAQRAAARPHPRPPTLLEAAERQRIAAVEGRPPEMGEVPVGSRQIDITIDPSDFAGPSQKTVATIGRSAPDEGEDDDDVGEVWLADDAGAVGWRRFRLRGRTVGSLGAAALARVDRRIKRRFLDRALRRLT